MRRTLIFGLLVVVNSASSANILSKNNSSNRGNGSAVSVQETISTTTRRPLIDGLRLPCSCFGGQCGCCTGLILERFRQKACLNITYEPDDFAFTAGFSVNEKLIYKNTVSGKNPPPMCVRLPRIRFIELCVTFSNIYFAKQNVHLCIDADASWQDFTLLEWSFDCIRMGVNGIAVVTPEQGGGLPANPVDLEEQTDEDYDDDARDMLFRNLDKKNTRGPSTKVPDKIPATVNRLANGYFLIKLNNSN